MIPIVCLDPSAIWMIDEADDLDGAEEIILRCLRWLQVGRGLLGEPHVVGSSIQSLEALHLYPVIPRFEAELKRLGLTGVLSAQTLASSVNRFLAGAPTLEDVGAFRDAIIDKPLVDPDLITGIQRDDLLKISVDTTALIALNSGRFGREASLAYPRLEENVARCRVTGDIQLIEANVGFEDELDKLDATISVIRDQPFFLDCLDPTQVWESANDSSSLELAVALRAKAVGGLNSIRSVPEFRLGSAFLATLQAAQCAGSGVNSGVTLEKCARAVIDPALVGAEPFRTTEKASSPPRLRQRDGAVAMRAHVTQGHEALRLMYWRRPDGSPEFSCVRNKRDLVIDDGARLPPRGW